MKVRGGRDGWIGWKVTEVEQWMLWIEGSRRTDEKGRRATLNFLFTHVILAPI